MDSNEQPTSYVEKLLSESPKAEKTLPDGTKITQYVVHPKHLAAAMMSDENVKGANWHKCPNCGDPFNGVGELCSDDCEREFLAYLQSDVDRYLPEEDNW